MKPVPSPNYVIVCRSAFCVSCWKADRPQKGAHFIVFGSAAQEFKTRVAHHDGIKGFTPHLYTIQYPYRITEEGKVYCVRTCLIDGCGIKVGDLRKDGRYDLQFILAQESALSIPAADALISLWKNSGYELL